MLVMAAITVHAHLSLSTEAREKQHQSSATVMCIVIALSRRQQDIGGAAVHSGGDAHALTVAGQADVCELSVFGHQHAAYCRRSDCGIRNSTHAAGAPGQGGGV